jgi:hypothetical protein
MSQQKTNLNVSPYYDDFDPDKNFYRVLFKPGHPVQARELTTLQSILQDQISSFGSHIFKEGSVVIPGNFYYDNQYYSIQLKPDNLGVDVSVYVNELVGKVLRGVESNVTAIVDSYKLVSESEAIENLTLFVKYLETGDNGNNIAFFDGETLITEDTITYGNTTINIGDSVGVLIDTGASTIGSTFSIQDGVYFIRGTFVKVNADRIILDAYSNTPSYRIGLKITEEIISAKDDGTLYDNARGFSNFAAPGADRLKITTSLHKKLLTDFDDKDFVELLRVVDGSIRILNSKSDYSLIKDWVAQRTFEESGNYTLDKVKVEVSESLNDRISNNGSYLPGQTTDNNSVPSEDLLTVKISPGKAYVRGVDVDIESTRFVDLEKPRTGQIYPSSSIPFTVGSLLKVNKVFGTPFVGLNNENNYIELYDSRSNSTSSGTGNLIGKARVYSFQLSDSSYSSNSTEWDLHLFDIQTYTILNINNAFSSEDCPQTSFVKGLSSGATGYVVSSVDSNLTVSQTSGKFLKGEQIQINGSFLLKRSILSVKEYSISDIKSVYQNSNSLFSSFGFSSDFVADTVLRTVIPSGFSIVDTLTINSLGVATCPGKSFLGLKENSIIKYQIPGTNVETYNKISSISSDGQLLVLESIPSVTGVCNGSLPTETVSTTFGVGVPSIKDNESSGLYVPLESKDVYNVDISRTKITIFTI